MLDIEEFSLAAWSNPIAVEWHRPRNRGIIYTWWGRIGNSERFFPNELKRKVVEVETPSTYGT